MNALATLAAAVLAATGGAVGPSAVSRTLRQATPASLVSTAGRARGGTVNFHDGHGLHVVSVTRLDPRLFALTLRTAVLPSPAAVRVLLPVGYFAHPRRHYPVFYLLHGTSGDASNWTVVGDAEQVIGERSVITVMPDIALHDDGPGTHSWPYWTRDLRWSIAAIMSAFAHPSGAPRAVTYTSADDRYAVYGWRVTLHRRAREFSTLRRADAHGFTLAGSGSATVVTPPSYRPGTRYRVTVRGDRLARHSEFVTAGRDGHLSLIVALGPSNPFAEYSPQAVAAGTKVYATTVNIRASPR